MNIQQVKHIGLMLAVLLLVVACSTKAPPPPTKPPAASDITAPAAPQWANIVPGDTQVGLKWQANAEPDLDSYKLYWGESEDDLNKSESIPAGTTDHLLTGLKNGTTYFFALAAADLSGNVSLYSKVISAMPEAVPVPPPPPPPVAGDFSISTVKSLTVQKGQGKEVVVQIARNNFPEEISLSLESAPAGVGSDLPKMTAGEQVSLILSVAGDGSIAAGDYEVKLLASAKGISKVAKLDLKVEDAPIILPPPPPPAAGDFSIAPLGGVIVQKGQDKSVAVNLVRNSFPDDITLKLKSAPAGVSSDLPKVTAGNQVMMTLNVAASVNPGAYQVELEATGKGISKVAKLDLSVTEVAPPVQPKPEINSVSLEGFSDNQVRQGYGNVTLIVEGQFLSQIKEARLEWQPAVEVALGVPQPIPANILSKTDTTLKLQATIQHGTPTGSYDLVLVNGNVTKKGEVLYVTPIIAAPTGKDASGMGTHSQPFRSLTKAVSVATSADAVVLNAGEYRAVSGEVFPINVSGLKIRGAGMEKSILSGVGSANNCLIVNSGAADTSLMDLGVKDCVQESIRLEQGITYLINTMVSQSQSNGLRVMNSARATIRGSKFSDNALSGIIASHSALLTFDGNDWTHIGKNTGSGIHLLGNASLSGKKLQVWANATGLKLSGPGNTVILSESDFYGNANDGLLIENSQQVKLSKVSTYKNKRHGIYVAGNTKLEAIEGFSTSNDGDGINVNVAAGETADLKLEAMMIDQNGQSGIEYRSENPASKLTMMDSKVEKNTTYGVYIAGKPENIVLGLIKPGNNLFSDNGSTHLVDARDANTGTIFAVGNAFKTAGVAAPVSGFKIGPASQLPHWQIVNVGNKISFGAL